MQQGLIYFTICSISTIILQWELVLDALEYRQLDGSIEYHTFVRPYIAYVIHH